MNSVRNTNVAAGEAELLHRVDGEHHRAAADMLVVRALQIGARELGVRLSAHEVRDGLPPAPTVDMLLGPNSGVAREWAVKALRRRSFAAAWRTLPIESLRPAVLPAIVFLDNDIAVLCRYGEYVCELIVPSMGDDPVQIATETIRSQYAGEALLFKPQAT